MYMCGHVACDVSNRNYFELICEMESQPELDSSHPILTVSLPRSKLRFVLEQLALECGKLLTDCTSTDLRELLRDKSKKYGQAGKYLSSPQSEFASCFVQKIADVGLSYTWSTDFESLLGKVEEFELEFKSKNSIADTVELTYFLDILFVGKSHIF